MGFQKEALSLGQKLVRCFSILRAIVRTIQLYQEPLYLKKITGMILRPDNLFLDYYLG